MGILDAPSYSRAQANAKLAAAIKSGKLSPVGTLNFTPATYTNFRPFSIGDDGKVYGRVGGALIAGRLNAGATALDGASDFASKPEHSGGGSVRWVTKTEAGYVVITCVADLTHVWFASAWGSVTNYSLVATVPKISNDPLGIPQPAKTPDGKTVLIVAPWSGIGGTDNIAPWGSFDGGATWAALTNPRSTSGTGPSNNHWHSALYHSRWERLWLSGGDGVNSYFGYSDDKGVTWHNSQTPTDSPIYDSLSYQQPTMMIGFEDRIMLGPDRGSFPPGVWVMDPITGKTARKFRVDTTVATADRQYPIYPHAQSGNVAYVAYPASGSMPVETRDHTDIVATGDGGRSWHNVGRVPWAGVTTMAANGIAGPDANGYLYMVGPTGLTRAPQLEWQVT